MLTKPEDCIGCVLHDKDPQGFISAEGSGTLGVLAFGEAGGASERSDGLPFRPYAEAGSMLQRAFQRLGYDRQQFALGNIVNCQPTVKNWLDGAPWEYEAINNCRIHRDRMVQRYQPRCLLALGGVALRTLTAMAGRKQGVLDLRGYVLPAADYFQPCCPRGRVKTIADPSTPCQHCGSVTGKGQPIPVVAATHPSYVKRARGLAGGKGGSTAETGPFYNDIEKAVQVARNGWDFDSYKPAYISGRESDIIGLYDQLRACPDIRLAWDLETNTSAESSEDELLGGAESTKVLKSIQFSTGKGTGYYFPWREPFISWSRKILALSNVKLSWNGWLFDQPLMEALSWEVSGEHLDLMWAYHSLQPDLPLGLQYAASFFDFPFPWKHWAQTREEDYGCVDVDVLHWIDERIWRFLDQQGVRRSYDEHKLRLNPILRKATKRGFPVNEERREDLGVELQRRKETLNREMQELMPAELLKVHPKEGYKVLPKDLKELLEHIEVSDVPLGVEIPERYRTRTLPNQKVLVYQPHLPLYVQQVLPAEHQGEPTIWDYRLFPVDMPEGVIDNPPTGLLSFSQLGDWRWCKILPFKPGSWQQVLAYIKHKTSEEAKLGRRRAKWYVPKTYKEDRETTEARELERLQKRTDDPLLTKVLDYREVDKMHGTYVVGWQPGLDGRIHATFKHNTGTGQLVAVNPNAMTPPKHRSIAKSWARMIEARPGKVLVNLDYKSFHALTTGFEAKDKQYMRMARLDIHAFLTSHFVKDPVDPSLSDGEVMEKLTWIKQHHRHIRDYKAKRVVLGRGFGMGPNKCYRMYQENFGSLSEVKRLFATMEDLFPDHKRWMGEVTLEAHHPPCCLLSRHGYLRRFFRVFDWDGRRDILVPGPDHEAAIAYRPANDAHGHFKDSMLRLEARGLLDAAGFILPVHDDLRFEMPEKEAPELIAGIYGEMVKPSEILVDEGVAPGGLSVDVEVTVGRNWAPVKDPEDQSWSNPEGMQDWDVGRGEFLEAT